MVVAPPCSASRNMRIFCSVVYPFPLMVWVPSGFPDQLPQWLSSRNPDHTDVPVTINRHKHVPVKLDYIDQISTNRNLYEEQVGNLAYSLGVRRHSTTP